MKNDILSLIEQSGNEWTESLKKYNAQQIVTLFNTPIDGLPSLLFWLSRENHPKRIKECLDVIIKIENIHGIMTIKDQNGDQLIDYCIKMKQQNILNVLCQPEYTKILQSNHSIQSATHWANYDFWPGFKAYFQRNWYMILGFLIIIPNLKTIMAYFGI
ncbi:MAG: hypothetical protein ACON5A_05585 [Candidatus Comchoanobacterales bacterium]